MTDIQLLALCIWGEARGEPVIGQLAVAHVVINRVGRKSWYGHTVKAVIERPYQFSFLNGLEEPWPTPGPVQMAIAELALGGFTKDPTNGATHYHADFMTPGWAADLKYLLRIGGHLFYREK